MGQKMTRTLNNKRYDVAAYNAEMADFYKDLKTVRTLVENSLHESLSSRSREQLLNMRRDLWNKRISLTMHRAFMGLSTEQMVNILNVFNFENLSKIEDVDQLVAETNKIITDLAKKVKTLKELAKEVKLQGKKSTYESINAEIKYLEKTLFALQAGQTSMLDFINTINKVATNKRSGVVQTIADTVFMAAGAFIAAACTAVLFPVIHAKYYFSALAWQMGLVGNVYEQSEILSYPTSFLTVDRSYLSTFTFDMVKNILILPLVIDVVRIMALLNAAALGVRDISRAAYRGAQIGKSTTNAEYASKVKLLQAIDDVVDLNSPAYTGATLLQRLMGTANPIPKHLALPKGDVSLNFELSNNVKSRFNRFAPGLGAALTKHFTARAKKINVAYNAAVKSNDIVAIEQIFKEYEDLQEAWKSIIRPLQFGKFTPHSATTSAMAINDYIDSSFKALEKLSIDGLMDKTFNRTANPVVVFKYGLHPIEKLGDEARELAKIAERIEKFVSRGPA